MRTVLAAVVALGCHRQAPPAAVEAPEPPCVPALETSISQLKDATESVPDGVGDAAAFDAVREFLVGAGQTIDTIDREAHTLETTPFVGETIEWTCDMKEYREYTYRVTVASNKWTVGLGCKRSYGWEAHMAGDKVVEADHGVLTECLDTAKYGSRLDAMRSRTVLAGARKLLSERASPGGP